MLKRSLLMIGIVHGLSVATCADISLDSSFSSQQVAEDFQGPTALAMHGSYAYVCNLVGASISVVDIQSNQVITTIKDSSMLSPFSIAIINGYAYVTNLFTRTISIIDVTNNTFVTTVSEKVQAVHRITASSISDKNLLFLVSRGVMQIIDVSSPLSPTIIQTFSDADINGLGIAISEAPCHSLYVTAVAEDNQGKVLVYPHMKEGYFGQPTAMVSPKERDGQWLTGITTVGNSYAYACDETNDTVQVYDLQKGSYFTSIPGFNSPIAIASNRDSVYVCNFGKSTHYDSPNDSSTISIIDTRYHEVRTSLKGAYSPQALAFGPNSLEIVYISARGGTGSTAGRLNVFRTYPGLFDDTLGRGIFY